MHAARTSSLSGRSLGTPQRAPATCHAAMYHSPVAMRASWVPTRHRCESESAPSRHLGFRQQLGPPPGQLHLAAAEGGSGSGGVDNGGAAPGGPPLHSSASTSGQPHTRASGAGPAASTNGPPPAPEAPHGASSAHPHGHGHTHGHGHAPLAPPTHTQPAHPSPHHQHGGAAAAVGTAAAAAAAPGSVAGSQDGGGAGGSMDAAANKGLVHSGSRASFKNVMK